MNIEVVVIIAVWIINILVSGFFYFYAKKNKRRPTDYMSLPVGLIVWNIFVAILCILLIIKYLQG